MTVALAEPMEEHSIHALLGKSFEWTEGVEAFEWMMNQSVTGKIVARA